jgi:hypothetical protein
VRPGTNGAIVEVGAKVLEEPGRVLGESAPGTVVCVLLGIVGPVGAGTSEEAVVLAGVPFGETGTVLDDALTGVVVVETSATEFDTEPVEVVCALTVSPTPATRSPASTSPTAPPRTSFVGRTPR